MINIAALGALLAEMIIYSDKKIQIAFLLIKKAIILNKYFDFAKIFLEKKALILLEQIKLNKHISKLKNDKKLFYRPIYSLKLVELKTLKIYVEIYLNTRFIWPFKSFAGAFILFDKKPDGSF